MSTNLFESSANSLPEIRPARRHLRFLSAADAPVVRFTDAQGLEIVGTLENESYSGIAAVIASASGLSVGAAVSVDYFGHPMAGTVRRLAQQENGTWLAGIEW